jgi:phospholipid/cholesterol/gamma-HCH transport system ATP-binding protein
MALIEARGITSKFGSQVIHDRLDLTLEENEVLGLIGGSGSGKSVLLRTLLGLRRPQRGEVRVAGKNIFALPPEEMLEIQKRWGVLFQNGALFSGLRVLDNVALPLREHTDLSPAAIADIANLKLQMVGLKSDVADKYPAALSGGMTTRAAIARAMALDPAILFLDEPTGALDPISAAAFDDLVRSLRDLLKLSMLIITHDLSTIVSVCDRVAMIADKKVICGTVEDLARSSNPEVAEFFNSPRMVAALAKGRKRN